MSHVERLTDQKAFPAGYHELAQSFPALQGTWLPALSRLTNDQSLAANPQLLETLSQYCSYCAVSNEALVLEVHYANLLQSLHELKTDDLEGFPEALGIFQATVENDMRDFSNAWAVLSHQFPRLSARLVRGDRQKDVAQKVGPMIEALSVYSRSHPQISLDLKAMRSNLVSIIQASGLHPKFINKDKVSKALIKAGIPNLLFASLGKSGKVSIQDLKDRALGLVSDCVDIISGKGVDETLRIAKAISATRESAIKVTN